MTKRDVCVAALAAILSLPVLASGGSGGGGGQKGGGGTPAPGGAVLPGQTIIAESFGLNFPTGRPAGGKGTIKSSQIHTGLSGFWAEFPATSAYVWSTPDGKGVQTWSFSGSSLNPKQPPTAWDPADQNGTATAGSGTGSPAALLPFAPVSIPYEVSLDLVQQPRVSNDWLAVGFSSSNATSHNFETSGQAWLRIRASNPLVEPWSQTVELHTNGLAGLSISANVILTGFDTLTVRVDPVAKTVTGLFNGTVLGTLPYAATPNHVGFEATDPLGVITVDHFLVKASN